MSSRLLTAWKHTESLDPSLASRRTSFARLSVTEALFAFGVITGICGIVDLFSDRDEALVLLIFAGSAVAIGSLGHRTFERTVRPPPSRILGGLVLTWITLVILGLGVYLATGAIATPDAALVESAAGFSTTNLTLVHPTDLSPGLQIWRASTQWFGGFLGLVIGVIALPQALRGSSLLGRSIASHESRMVSRPIEGRYRIMRVYAAFTTVLAGAYALTGMPILDSVVHAFSTASTGGFSTNADSFVGVDSAGRAVATVGMLIAGSSFFVIWWMIRGRVTSLIRSSELRVYALVVVSTSLLLAFTRSGLPIGESIFTAASAVSTTGYAVGDWTTLPSFALTLLLVVVAMGSMAGSAGGGLRVVRVHTLMKSGIRELRLQLDPHRIALVKNSGRPVEESSIQRISGYQIAHLLVCGAGAFVVALSGFGVVESLWTAVSTLSSFGPAPGIGAFGDVSTLDPWVRLALVPLMLAARLSVLVVLLGSVWIGDFKRRTRAAAKRRVRAFAR